MNMKMAKADAEEFDAVLGFINVMEALFDGRGIFDNTECWREWPDDDPDKQLMIECEKDIIAGDGETVYGPDNRLILYEFIRRKWNKVNWCGSFGRIVWDAKVMIDNACDPDLDYLEYNKEIKAALEAYNPSEDKSK